MRKLIIIFITAALNAPAVAAVADDLTAALADTAAQLRTSFGTLNASYPFSPWTGYPPVYETMDVLSRVAASGRGGPELANVCRAALASDDTYIRITAAMYLQEMEGPAVLGPFLLDEYKNSNADDVYTLAVFLGTAVTLGGAAETPGAADLWPVVEADITGGDAAARLKAARFLIYMPSENAQPLFQQLLQSPDVEIRRLATAAITRYYVGENPTQTIRENLTAALNDADAEVRRVAAYELGQYGDATALPPLLGRLADADKGSRRAAAAAVATLLRQNVNDDKKLPKEILKRLKAETDGFTRVHLAAAYGSAKAGVDKGVSYCDLTPDGYWAFFAGTWTEKEMDSYFAPPVETRGGG